MNTKDLLFSGDNRINVINDSDWYEGNVLFIEPSCADCPQKVKVNNHIQVENTRHLVSNLTSFVDSPRGGELLAEATLFILKTNGSFSSINPLHSNIKKKCVEVAVAKSFTVTGCIEDETVWLQAVSSVGTKPFVFEGQETSALGLVRLQVSRELVMLVDAEEDCYVKSRKGGVFLF